MQRMGVDNPLVPSLSGDSILNTYKKTHVNNNPQIKEICIVENVWWTTQNPSSFEKMVNRWQITCEKENMDN